MGLLKNIYQRASQADKSIILPEGDDPRVREAALQAVDSGLARVSLISKEPLDGVNTFHTEKDPLVYSLELLAAGEYDGLVAGATYKTADILRGALRNKTLCSGGLLSSFFLMETSLKSSGEEGAFLFADCAVIPDPNPKQLAEIAESTAASAEKILGWKPRLALLSFSTKGSSSHPAVEKVQAAMKILKEKNPGFIFDGELQLDTAIIPEVAMNKNPEGVLKGRANIIIFPDLNSGNIGYKLTERLGGARAIGPILQGMNRPVNDLSRGCSVSDIIDVIAFTALQA